MESFSNVKFRIGDDIGVVAVLYPNPSSNPVLLKNAHIAMQHLVIMVFEFSIWCRHFYQNNFDEYDDSSNRRLFIKIFEQYEKVYGSFE